jgi:hypothetical protein
MGLGLSMDAGGGDFTPWLKYDARAGRWFRKGDRDKNEPGPVDVTNGFSAVFDLSTIEVGWIDFPTGAAPILITQPISAGIPGRPTGGTFKQGFRMRAALPAALGGGVYEVAASAKAMIGAIDALHTAYTAAPEAAQGKLPVVAMTGTTMIETTTPKGTNRNYAPVLAITSWVARPASMPTTGFTSSQQPAPVATGAPPATGSTPVPPPAPKAAPAASADFG